MAGLGATVKIKMDMTAVKRGISKIQSMFQRLGAKIKGILRKAFSAPAAIGGALGGFLIQETAEWAKNLKAVEERTGMARKEILAMRRALELAGGEFGDTTDLVQEFNEKIWDAILNDGGTLPEGLAQLRRRAGHFAELGPEQKFRELVSAINEAQLGIGQLDNLLDKVFGGEGMKFTVFFKNFNELMGKGRDEVDGLNKALDEEHENLIKVHDAIGRLRLKGRTTAVRFIGSLNLDKIVTLLDKLPVEKIANAVGDFIGSVAQFVETWANHGFLKSLKGALDSIKPLIADLGKLLGETFFAGIKEKMGGSGDCFSEERKSQRRRRQGWGMSSEQYSIKGISNGGQAHQWEDQTPLCRLSIRVTPCYKELR